MGLVSTVGALGSTAANVDTLFKDTVNSAASYIGLDKPFQSSDDEDFQQFLELLDRYSSQEYEDSWSNEFLDLRGTSQVYRDMNNSYQSNQFGMTSFKSIYDMDAGDFCWTDNVYNGRKAENFKPKVQKIILKEFQPYQQTFLGQLTTTGLNLMQKYSGKNAKAADLLGEGTTGLTLLASMLGGSTNIMGKFLKNALIYTYSKNPNLLYQKALATTLTNPMTAVQQMFTAGNFLHTYIIPYLPKNDGLKLQSKIKMTDQTGGSIGNLLKDFGGAGFSADTKGATALQAGIATIPSTPNFTNTLDINSNISTEFYLINKDSQYIVRNYRFMQSFFSGTQVVQFGMGMLQCPNIFYVEIPKKRQMVWAAVELTISQVGRYKCDQYAFKKIYEQTNSKIFESTMQSQSYKKMLWPEAWKIEVNIKDFTPNTFNIRQHYLAHGSCLTALKTNIMGSVERLHDTINEANAKRQAKAKQQQNTK